MLYLFCFQIENNLKATPKGSDKEDRDITPEDKDNSLRVSLPSFLFQSRLSGYSLVITYIATLFYKKLAYRKLVLRWPKILRNSSTMHEKY